MRKSKKKKSKYNQPYKVGKPFVEWMESQIEVMDRQIHTNRWEGLENEITKEAYEFILGVVKP